ncbi:MAG: phosphopantetheine-binding protein [Pseudonocardiaceae bacterium]
MTLHESEVAQVWAEVLGVQRVDSNANFFDIGGNSLLLLELISRLNQSLGVDTDVLTLLELPTVAKFTSHRNASEVTTVTDTGEESR